MKQLYDTPLTDDPPDVCLQNDSHVILITSIILSIIRVAQKCTSNTKTLSALPYDIWQTVQNVLLTI